MDKIASLVFLRVSESMSVIAILEHPDRAKPFATAAPIPSIVSNQILQLYYCMDVPVPPAPVMMATPGKLLRIDAISAGLALQSYRTRCLDRRVMSRSLNPLPLYLADMTFCCGVTSAHEVTPALWSIWSHCAPLSRAQGWRSAAEGPVRPHRIPNFDSLHKPPQLQTTTCSNTPISAVTVLGVSSALNT